MNDAAFTAGQRVRILGSRSVGHCRTPRYVRGKSGVVEGHLGEFRNPEDLAYGGSGTPACSLYWVRLRLADVFEHYAGVATDTLLIEIQAHWLIADPVAGAHE